MIKRNNQIIKGNNRQQSKTNKMINKSEAKICYKILKNNRQRWQSTTVVESNKQINNHRQK